MLAHQATRVVKAVADHSLSAQLPKPAQWAAAQAGLATLAAGEVDRCWQATTFRYGEEIEGLSLAAQPCRWAAAVAVVARGMLRPRWAGMSQLSPWPLPCSTHTPWEVKVQEMDRWVGLAPFAGV